jgi:hypothetical protein
MYKIVDKDIKLIPGYHGKTLIMELETNEYFIHRCGILTSGGAGIVETWNGESTIKDMDILSFLYNERNWLE